MDIKPEPLFFSVDKIKVVMLFSESLFSKKQDDLIFRKFKLSHKTNQVILYENLLKKETIELRFVV